MCYCQVMFIFFYFFFNDTATTEIYTLSLHDALPIFDEDRNRCLLFPTDESPEQTRRILLETAKRKLTVDRKSTRLNSSHTDISRMPSSA